MQINLHTISVKRLKHVITLLFSMTIFVLTSIMKLRHCTLNFVL